MYQAWSENRTPWKVEKGLSMLASYMIEKCKGLIYNSSVNK